MFFERYKVFLLKLFYNIKKELISADIGKILRYFLVISICLGICGVLLLYVYRTLMLQPTVINNLTLQNKDYLNRHGVISKIDNVLSKQKKLKVAIIVGVGGSGKTTVARKFLQKTQANILWEINAETDHSIFSSFLELATNLAVTKIQQEELSAIKSISNNSKKQRRLVDFTASSLCKCKKWCLLFDNVEEFSTISEYFPKNDTAWGNGILIITTRNKNLTHSFRIKEGVDIDIQNLSEEEQYELFCKILYGDSYLKFSSGKAQQIKIFLKNIPMMPLDVSSAAYYIKNTSASFSDYIKITQKTIKDFEKMQKKLLEESLGYGRTRYGIITSIFEAIITQNEQFKKLLLAICLLDSQDIPKDLLISISNPLLVDDFIYNLKKHSIISFDNGQISIHRSSQDIGLCYLIDVMTLKEKKELIDILVSNVTPFKKLETQANIDIVKFISHLNSILDKIGAEKIHDSAIDNRKIDLLITIGDIYRLKEHRSSESISYYKEALEVNKICNYLNDTEIALINLKIGSVFTLMSKDESAKKYLLLSLDTLSKFNDPIALARTYRLLGIISMRNDEFKQANNYFQKSIETLDVGKCDSVESKIAKANAYSSMAFNYFMDGINRGHAFKAVKLMEEAISILSLPPSETTENVKKHLITYKSRLSGIYNALGKYDLSLKEGKEAENLIESLTSQDNSTFHAQGIILREKALSNLRLNEVEKAYQYFMQAKEVFSKALIFDYLFRLKMHEAEALIRLNRLDEAFEVCDEIFSIQNRELNNYCYLFFNTCYYHAAIIKYKQGNERATRKYFREFFLSMQKLCKRIVPPMEYENLVVGGAFDADMLDLEKYFENSLKVFEAVYWKDYEFTKYYVEKNLKDFKKWNWLLVLIRNFLPK